MAVHMIVLAAGFSRRYGKNKLLTLFLGKPLYLHVVDRLTDIQRKSGREMKMTLSVVTQYQEIFQEMKKRHIPVVYNHNSSKGISSSLQTGLMFAINGGEKPQGRDISHVQYNGEQQYFCFFVGDQPYLQKSTIEAFIGGFLESGKGMGCLRCAGKNGNPVIFSQIYVDELMKLTGDTGGKKVLASHSKDVYYHEVKNNMELFDIDRPKNNL